MAIEQWLEIAPFLLIASESGDYLCIASIGRLGSENDGREAAAAEDLVHQAKLHLAEALTAQFGPEVASPQPLFLDQLLKLNDRRSRRSIDIERICWASEHQVERFHFLADKAFDPVELCLEVWISTKIPSHQIMPFS